MTKFKRHDISIEEGYTFSKNEYGQTVIHNPMNRNGLRITITCSNDPLVIEESRNVIGNFFAREFL